MVLLIGVIAIGLIIVVCSAKSADKSIKSNVSSIVKKHKR